MSLLTSIKEDPKFWENIFVGTQDLPSLGNNVNKHIDKCWLWNGYLGYNERLFVVETNDGYVISEDKKKRIDAIRKVFVATWNEPQVYVYGTRIPFSKVNVYTACRNNACCNPIHMTVIPRKIEERLEKRLFKKYGYSKENDLKLLRRPLSPSIEYPERVQGRYREKGRKMRKAIYNEILTPTAITGHHKSPQNTHRKKGSIMNVARKFNIPVINVFYIYVEMIKEGKIKP